MIFLNNFPDYEDHFGSTAESRGSYALLRTTVAPRATTASTSATATASASASSPRPATRLRELTFEIVQEQLKKVGIEIGSEFG